VGAGVYEVEPSMQWNPAVVAGIGFLEDPGQLYNDMHAYLSDAGKRGACGGARRQPFYFLSLCDTVALPVCDA
jgi:hypothetical protein